MKKTLFITMLTAALLGGNTYANTGYAGGELLYGNNICSEHGELVIFEDPNSQFAELGDVYGCLDGSPISHGASVTIRGGIVQNAYGGSHFEEVTYQNTVRMSGGTVRQVLCGGYCFQVLNDPNDNTVIVTGGSVGGCIYGGCSGAQEIANVQRNKVYITNLDAGCAPSVIGGSATGLSGLKVWRNEVHLVGEGASILIDGETYQGHAMTFNHVAGGECLVELSENSVDIYGSGIQAVSLIDTQILNFHLVDGLAAADTPMVSLSGDNPWKAFNMVNLTLGIKADAMTDLGLLAGRTVTLVESRLAITGFGESSYKVVNVSKGGQSDAAKALITLGNEGKDLLMTVLSSSTELLAPGESRQAGSATITALSQTEPGLLDNLTLGTDTISGQGRSDSSAGGLKIDSTADLLMEGMTLTANNRISVGENTLTLKEVTITGDWTVAAGSRLNLRENSTITGDVTLEGGSTLALGGSTHSGNVSLGWNTAIGNGSVNGNITFAAGNQQVSLCGDLGGTGDISIGVVNSTSPVPHPTFTSTLNLGGHTLSKGLKLVGDTTVSNGKLVLAHDMTRSLFDKPARTVTIGAETTVDLNSHTFSHNLAVEADTAIGNGTIGGNVTVNEGKSVRFFGETKIDSNNEGLVSYHGKIEIGGTTIQALHRPLESQIGAPVYPGLMKELTVSKGLIAGTDRQSSLADGLEIESTANLMIKGMTITADNKISVGQNTITLKDVTIKLSQASFDIVDGVYYFNLSDLFHCSVDMADVTFDASDLTLPEGFNPETNGISFNLGDAKLTAGSATQDITLLMGGYGSRTLSLDGQGNPVFTKLVETPEPATSTLSLLALAALAARRRKRK
ncbi:MAG: hypothetical protein Q4C88_09195 [Akkermansia sp.]|nr:hypothetical protein [Akkermansia sp.]